jgi:uncharacterized protein with PQ loop repeat
MEITMLEYVGYAASIAVAISFVMKDMRKLRVVNIIGCTLFVIYGFMFESLRAGLPVIITNVAIICVNTYYLFKMINERNKEISE